MGSPGRYSFCFAENENNTSWLSMAEERGVAKGQSAVTLLTGDGLQPIGDEKSRTPESLMISLSHGLRAVYHHKWAIEMDVILAMAPEHTRVFEQAGWSKQMVREGLEERLMMETAVMVQDAGGCAEGITPEMATRPIMPKFKADQIQIVRVGSDAGLYSAVISCWPTGGDEGTQPVTKVIKE